VTTRGEELGEAGGGLGDRVRRGDADDVEAFALAIGNQEGFGRAGVLDQKSRSA